MKMTSRERLLAAIDRQPVDHVPLFLRFWSISGEGDQIPFPWQDQVTRCENTLARALDDTLLLEPPLGYVENYSADSLPGVAVEVTRRAPASGEVYPLLMKVYHTPDGPLQSTIRITEDWPWGEDIRLFDDYNIPRLVEPWVKTEEDLPRLEHLLGEPTVPQFEAFRREANHLHDQAGRLEVALDGGWTALGDSAMWLCGMQRMLYAQWDEPDFVEALLDTILAWELRRIDQVIGQGIDVLVHSAWYEGCDFWSPRNFRRFLKPRLAQMVERAHQAGVRFRYIITKGWKPVQEDLIEIGVDCISGVDPIQDRLDLAGVKRQIGNRICLMGGLNSAALFTNESEEAQIRQAVDEAVRALSPGYGFILYPVDAVFSHQPWEKVETMIARWKEIR